MCIIAWNIDSTYLHGKIDHNIYISFPDSFGKLGKVRKLNKALDGLPEAMRVWCEDLEEKLKSVGFVPLGNDASMFLNKLSTGTSATETHVNNSMGICSSEEELRIKVILGILVTRDAHQDTLKLPMSEYIDYMLQNLNINDCNPIIMPMDKLSHLQDSESAIFENKKMYQGFTRSLTYATKGVPRYLKGTRDLGTMFRREPKLDEDKCGHEILWGFCDANSQDLKSTMLAVQPAHLAHLASVDLSNYDPRQSHLMAEQCILVDEQDCTWGAADKKTCHLMENINKGLLHCAFSVFVFHPSDGKLLLQQCASEKITFPDMWTNTCCSHPLDDFDEEKIEREQHGIKMTASRKLEHKLGILKEQMPIDKFQHLAETHLALFPLVNPLRGIQRGITYQDPGWINPIFALSDKTIFHIRSKHRHPLALHQRPHLLKNHSHFTYPWNPEWRELPHKKLYME